MLIRAMTYFMLLLVVLQSGAAMADAHQLHQSGTEHLVFDESHHHLDGSGPADQHNHEADAPSSQQSDCHHCCHCHGHFCPAILLSAERILLTRHSSPIPDYSENAFPDTFETFLRPPKA